VISSGLIKLRSYFSAIRERLKFANFLTAPSVLLNRAILISGSVSFARVRLL
jgi:hypothetical protein